MCLAVPMKVVEINEHNALAEIGGVKIMVNIQLVDNIKVGDYVIVHVGFAIEKLNEEEAKKTIDMLEDMEKMASLSE